MFCVAASVRVKGVVDSSRRLPLLSGSWLAPGLWRSKTISFLMNQQNAALDRKLSASPLVLIYEVCPEPLAGTHRRDGG